MSQPDSDVTELGLERYAFELEVNGLTIIPPAETGMSNDTLDRAGVKLPVVIVSPGSRIDWSQEYVATQ